MSCEDLHIPEDVKDERRPVSCVGDLYLFVRAAQMCLGLIDMICLGSVMLLTHI